MKSLLGMMDSAGFLNEGLVGWWCPTLDPTPDTGVLTDLSGNGNHGSLVNMDPNVVWVPDGDGLSLDFDGGDSYVEIPHSDKFNFVPGFTVSFHVYLRTITSGNSGFISKWTVHSEGWRIDNGRDRYRLANFNANNSAVEVRTFYAPVFNVWTHIAVTFDDQYRRLFRNGKFESEIANPSSHRNTLPLFIGRTLRNLEVDALMDDIRIYDRALTPDEILLLSSERGI